MLVRFKRNWFGPGGTQFRTRDGLSEVPDEWRDQLPADAVVMDSTIVLPTKGAPPLPGFGAKPEYEQKLDDIGAAPTHIITAAGVGQEPAKNDFLDPDGSAEKEAEARKDAEKAFDLAKRETESKKLTQEPQKLPSTTVGGKTKVDL